MRFPWQRRKVDPDQFQRFGPPQTHRDARPEIVEEFQEEIAAVSALLFRADPIGINFGSNADEYDPEARTIVARQATFPGAMEIEDVLSIVHEEFVTWFDDGIAGERHRYVSVAADILCLWGKTAAGS